MTVWLVGLVALASGRLSNVRGADLPTYEDFRRVDRLRRLTGQLQGSELAALGRIDGEQLLARAQATLGKLRDAPNDLCVRNYPVATHKDACMRISRQHVQIRADQATRQAMLTDLGAGNGTRCDGRAMAPEKPERLGGDQRVDIAGVLTLRCRALARRGTETWVLAGAAPSTGGDACGIEAGHAHDAVVLTRIDNRPELAYVLLLRRVSIGTGADLDLGGAPIELGRYDGRWIWRPTGHGHPWQPVRPGESVGDGWAARAGAYEDFQ